MAKATKRTDWKLNRDPVPVPTDPAPARPKPVTDEARSALTRRGIALRTSLFEQVAAIAKENSASVNNVMVYALTRLVEEYATAHGRAELKGRLTPRNKLE